MGSCRYHTSTNMDNKVVNNIIARPDGYYTYEGYFKIKGYNIEFLYIAFIIFPNSKIWAQHAFRVILFNSLS